MRTLIDRYRSTAQSALALVEKQESCSLQHSTVLVSLQYGGQRQSIAYCHGSAVDLSINLPSLAPSSFLERSQNSP